MSFDSWIYGLFLPLVLLPYFLLGRRGQNVLLLLASLVFYGWWDWRFLGLIAVSTVIDYAAAVRIDRTDDGRTRKRWVAASIVSNLAILGTFKYLGFFSESARALLEALGMSATWTTLEVVLPVGISFYTFQSLSYTIDVYRKRLPATDNFLEFALYVTFFPQLVAGPIERAVHLMPQFQRERKVTTQHLAEGAYLILLGLFKKVGLADAMAIVVNATYGDVGGQSTVHLWRSVYLFTFQIYCDFSGYSDIARGSARLLGFDLMENFRQPFLASGFRDLWRRWHISLSTWFRDYLYVPLGGGRGGTWTAMRNVFLVMAISGLWHGANWTFVAWGVAHGLLVAAERLFAGASPPPAQARWTSGRILRTVLVFHVFALLFVPFRARDFATAWEYLCGLFRGGFPASEWSGLYLALYYGVLILALDLLQESTRSHVAPLRWPWPVRGALYAFAILFIIQWSWGSGAFIYFQF